MILVAAGAAVGIASGVAAGQLLKRILFSVNPAEWKTFVLVAMVLTLVAALACVIPARRAMKVDPMAALRSE
jgi:putative ABC transport system permease protein